jgi:hypothetical protein
MEVAIGIRLKRNRRTTSLDSMTEVCSMRRNSKLWGRRWRLAPPEIYTNMLTVSILVFI